MSSKTLPQPLGNRSKHLDDDLYPRYECMDCGKRFDRVSKNQYEIIGLEKLVCPKCGSHNWEHDV